jgi:hypothetical protein
MDIVKRENRNSKDESKASSNYYFKSESTKNSILDTFLHSNDNNHFSVLDDTSFEVLVLIK